MFDIVIVALMLAIFVLAVISNIRAVRETGAAIEAALLDVLSDCRENDAIHRDAQAAALRDLRAAVEAIGQGRHTDALRQRTERVYHELSRPEARRDHSQR